MKGRTSYKDLNESKQKQKQRQFSLQIDMNESNNSTFTETAYSGLSPRYILNYIPNQDSQQARSKTPREEEKNLTPRRRLLKLKLGKSESSGKGIESKLAKLHLMINKKENIKDVVSYIQSNKIILLENSPEIFEIDTRMGIWLLESDMRMTLKYLVEKVREQLITKQQLKQLLFTLSMERYNDIDGFLNQLIENYEKIFDQHGNPEYDSDGNIILISSEMFFSLAIHCLTDKRYLYIFISSYPVFMKTDELFELIKKEDQRYKGIFNDSNGQINATEQQKHQNFEIILKRFIELEHNLPAQIKNQMNRMIAPEYYSEELVNLFFSLSDSNNPNGTQMNPMDMFQQNQIVKPSNDSKSSKKQKLSESKSKQRKNLPKLSVANLNNLSVEALSENDVGIYDVTFEKIMNVKSVTIAKQLVIYHWKLLTSIDLYHFYNVNESEAIQTYNKQMSSLQQLIRKIFQYHKKEYMIKFIEIAIYCSLLNDFTMSHILYAILKEEQTNECEIFTETMKSNQNIETKWIELEHLFSIVKNYNNYRSTYQALSQSTPRIPYMSLWFEDMEMVRHLPTVDEIHGLLNLEKLRNFRELIETMALVKSLPYQITENESFQFFITENC